MDANDYFGRHPITEAERNEFVRRNRFITLFRIACGKVQARILTNPKVSWRSDEFIHEVEQAVQEYVNGTPQE